MWLGEVKDQRRRLTPVDVELVRRKADFLRSAHRLCPGPVRLVCMGGFTEAARRRAGELDVLISTASDLKALGSRIGTRRRA